MAEDLLRKLALLQARMIPKAGQAIGFGLGGPAGASVGSTVGGAVGSGLESLLQPQQNPYEGGLMLPQQGGGLMTMPGQAEPMEDAATAFGQNLSAAGTEQLMGQMGQVAQQPKQEGISDDWLSLLQKVMATVPKEQIEKWLESRT